MVLGLAVLFWVSGALGKIAFAAIPAGFPPLFWRWELGFLAVLAGWWFIHPQLFLGSAFWAPAALAAVIEVVVTSAVWWMVRREGPQDLSDVMRLLSRFR